LAQVYFHCCNDSRVLMDDSPAEIDDLVEACERATQLVQTLIAAPSMEDWRNWTLHVSDERGDEIFVMPFAAVLGKPN
jgi:hypothetical protein